MMPCCTYVRIKQYRLFPQQTHSHLALSASVSPQIVGHKHQLPLPAQLLRVEACTTGAHGRTWFLDSFTPPAHSGQFDVRLLMSLQDCLLLLDGGVCRDNDILKVVCFIWIVEILHAVNDGSFCQGQRTLAGVRMGRDVPRRKTTDSNREIRMRGCVRRRQYEVAILHLVPGKRWRQL